jgi:type IV pilus assembly protein PilO
MPDLKSTKSKLIAVVAGMIAIDVVAAGILLSPLVGSQQSRRTQIEELWKELRIKTKQVEPLRGMDKKIASAQEQIQDFYQQRLPQQDSDISEALGKVASESGVKMSTVKYSPKDEQLPGLAPVMIEADFSGGYSQLVRFINALERNKLFFMVDGLDLDSAQGGTVQLRLSLETYLRTGA